MAKRRPNTAHWQLIERTFRIIASRSWRRAAAEALGVERSQLRDLYDSDDYDGAEIDCLHFVLQDALDLKRAELDAHLRAVSSAAFTIDRLQNDRAIEQRRIEEEALNGDGRERFRVMMERFMAELNEEAA
jgi:hypothetical protein